MSNMSNPGQMGRGHILYSKMNEWCMTVTKYDIDYVAVLQLTISSLPSVFVTALLPSQCLANI